LKNRFDFTRLAELDSQFREYAAHKQPTTPRAGWVKAIRLAIGMSSDTLGNRIGISGQGLRKLEMSEADRSITLKTLDRLADALDCDVQYILAPRTSLIDQLIEQARKRSVDRPHPEYAVDPVDHHTSSVGEVLALLGHIDKRGFWQHPNANTTGSRQG
jgi:predicted DNA-binding mobile mystery protein A